MARHQVIRLLDQSSRRRAAITHCLDGDAYRVDPYESVEEMVGGWPHDGVLLVHDSGTAVRSLLEAMTATGQWAPIIAFGEEASPHRVVEAVLEGALDYLVWPFDRDALAAALDWAGRCESIFAGQRLREARARGRLGRLTAREREVLACVTEGLSNRRIGDKLGISPRTVEIHRANMLIKIGAQNTSEAIRVAIEAALVA